MNRKDYPPDWEYISWSIKRWAGWRCEECGRDHSEVERSRLLTVHHIDHDPENNKRENLISLCSRCHLKADLRYHQKNAYQTRELKKQKLYFLEDLTII